MAENIKTFEVATDASAYQQRLNDLDKKIASVKKNITYLDALNITDAVISKENFAAQVNALVPNSSLVINTEPFNENGENYNRGDVILKDANDTVHHIPGQQGGLYYPTSVTQNGANYNINYKFTPVEPTNGDISISVNSSISSPVSNITFTGLDGGSAGDSFIYGLWTNNSIFYLSFTTETDEAGVVKFGQWIEPMIEFYFVSGANMEKVEIDYKIEEEDNNIVWGTDVVARFIKIPDGMYAKVK